MKKLFLLSVITGIVLLLSCSVSDGPEGVREKRLEDPDYIAKVGLQPIGKFEKTYLDTIKKAIEAIYGLEVVILPEMALPKSAYTTVRFPRYRADSLLHILDREIPDSLDFIMGLTSVDISTTKTDKDGNIKKPESKYIDFGIFGLGYCPGNATVISVFRLENKNRKIFFERIKKVCVHELGHNFGLPHCPTITCVMEDAKETIKTIDNEELRLCEKCLAKISK